MSEEEKDELDQELEDRQGIHETTIQGLTTVFINTKEDTSKKTMAELYSIEKNNQKK